MKTLLACAGVLVVIGTACNSPSPRLNAPPQGCAENTSEMQGMYANMTDNALLADMTVTDVHFLPHRALLNELGQERLSRLAALIEAYGGEVRFSSDEQDPRLLDERVAAIRDFLCGAGLDTSSELVRADLPGGRGLTATEVILIRANEGTFVPKKSSGGTATPTGMNQSQGVGTSQ